jgi:thiol-disulfide isomerase/thioredoxin
MRTSRSNLSLLLVPLGMMLVAVGLSGATPIIADLNGNRVEPLSFTAEPPAIILFFVAPDCPISNRYAPTMSKLAAKYATKGAVTWLIYADDQADFEAIRSHQTDFKLRLPTAIDREYSLTKYTGADVTPEAVVYVPGKTPNTPPQLIYRGRIDDQYEGFGRYRPAATDSELTRVLDQIVAGTVPDQVITKAIGCYIPK